MPEVRHRHQLTKHHHIQYTAQNLRFDNTISEHIYFYVTFDRLAAKFVD